VQARNRPAHLALRVGCDPPPPRGKLAGPISSVIKLATYNINGIRTRLSCLVWS
jgi:hypothetical protein